MALKQFFIWPEAPLLSIFVLAVFLVLALYIARTPVRRAILSFSRVLFHALRLSARSVLLAEQRLQKRNREVLLSAGMEQIERTIEREFHRVNAVVERDLQGYPALHRKMADLLTRIDEDYRQSAETPPPLPEWVKIIDSIVKIPAASESMIASILKEIHRSLERFHREAMEAYREATKKRHGLLHKMMPYWRKLSKSLEDVGKTIGGLIERSKVIDEKMRAYEDMIKGRDRATRILTSSAFTQFVISGLVLLIAIGGAVINFNLIALPMSEMVGGGSYIGPFRTADVAAMVIILVEAAMGIYLLEALRITRLFPIIGSMNDRMRKRMILISFIILTILACVEASLAFMRDMIAADIEALRKTLAGGTQEVQPVYRWIPTVGQMVMGFVLPFALAFVAIPLESFIHSSRTVLGVVLAWLLRVTAFGLRLLGNIIHSLGKAIVETYDVIIFPALWIERHLKDRLVSAPRKVEPKEVSK